MNKADIEAMEKGLKLHTASIPGLRGVLEKQNATGIQHRAQGAGQMKTIR